MKYQDSNGWFLFRFEKSDYKQYGSLRINTFLVDLRKFIPPSDRKFYPDENEWQIKHNHKRQFNELFQKHIRKNQRSLF